MTGQDFIINQTLYNMKKLLIICILALYLSGCVEQKEYVDYVEPVENLA